MLLSVQFISIKYFTYSLYIASESIESHSENEDSVHPIDLDPKAQHREMTFGDGSNNSDSVKEYSTKVKKQFYNPDDIVKTKIVDKRRKSHLDSGVKGLKSLNLSEPEKRPEEKEGKYSKKNKVFSNISTTFSEKRDAMWYQEYWSLMEGDYPEGVNTLADKIKYEFESKYINLNDPRIKSLIEDLVKAEENGEKIDFLQFKQIMKPKYTLFRSILQNQVTIKNCEKFIKETQKIFDEVKECDDKGFIQLVN